ncbi:lipopolysaccharide assembly protein LapA domain-containing protein [Marilutibacter spongiae]|uniref:DUF1049 domain-containing protein n=1 Tax=Marilutibacter spongiae TaxID=2025720 RepID=A0A7W3Y5Z3_9GAMM|nr:lipopolysaccharide assembly protein LapA domain-containing protein [Lysobacter spongiae]MBB1060495.1 DUF1049 domain-containing protein [Lysobacter spongiae]
MRLIRLIIAFVCLAVGAILGALNRDLVDIDFAVARVTTTLGVALIVSLLSGVLLGGLAIAASVVLPLRRRLGRLERQTVPRAATAPQPVVPGDQGGR